MVTLNPFRTYFCKTFSQGDSGAGLFIRHNNVFYLKGIVSASLIDKEGKCDVNNVAVYTEVSKFIDWIRNTEPYAEPIIEKPLLKSNESSSLQCGKVSHVAGLVIGGTQSRKGDWPFVAAIYKKPENIFFAAGSLITSRHVLTGKTLWIENLHC